jgi:hypothetical protein
MSVCLTGKLPFVGDAVANSTVWPGDLGFSLLMAGFAATARSLSLA